MLSYSQRDPRWAQLEVGKSGQTIGRIGCTLTCIADLSTYFGDNLTPKDVNALCKFTDGGLIIWRSVVFNSFRFLMRGYIRSDREIADAIADPNKAVILEVANRSHWVVATGVTWPYNIFKIADPIKGDRATMDRYKNNITGYAIFSRI